MHKYLLTSWWHQFQLKSILNETIALKVLDNESIVAVNSPKHRNRANKRTTAEQKRPTSKQKWIQQNHTMANHIAVLKNRSWPENVLKNASRMAKRTLNKNNLLICVGFFISPDKSFSFAFHQKSSWKKNRITLEIRNSYMFNNIRHKRRNLSKWIG